MNFMRFMAEELREYMAKLGVRTVDELVGRTDLLKVKPAPAGSRASDDGPDARFLQNPLIENSSVHFDPKAVYDFQLEKTPDMKVLMKKFKKDFDTAEPKPMTVTLDVGNTDRAFGTHLWQRDHRQVRQHACRRTPSMWYATAAAARALAPLSPSGLTLELVGDSNDYFGKGLSGGKIVVYPPKEVAL